MIPAGWHADPTGRHELRYWDGRGWTDAVADAGVAATDPPAWPAAPAATGLGLACGQLWYQRGDGRIPWTVVDPEGAVAGWVIPPGPLTIGPQTVPLLDSGRQQVAVLDQQLTSGHRVLVGGTEVARLREHGIGGMQRVAWAIEVAGSLRLRLQTALPDLHAGPCPVVDRGGAPVAALAMRWNRDARVDFFLERRTVLPPALDAALLLLPVAITLDLDTAAALSDRQVDGRHWPGL